MAPKLGKNMKLYVNTGTIDTPVWSEISGIGDLSVNGLERAIAEIKRRGKDFTKTLPALIGAITVEFRFIHGVDSTRFDALRTAFFAATTEQYAVMNGAIETSGNEGLKLPCFPSSFPWEQPLEEVSGHDVVLSGSAYLEDSSGDEVDPAWYQVS